MTEELENSFNKIIAERDEARRLYCVMAANVMYKSKDKLTAKHVANNMNWDCYKDDILSREVSQEQAQGDIK